MFEEMTYERILSDMLAQITDGVDKREGAMIYDALAPMAFRLAEAYRALDDVAANLNPATAARSYLCALGRNWGVKPGAGKKAVLSMTVTPSDIPISIGTIFRAGTASFSVTENRTGGCYAVTAAEAGTQGNLAIGAALIPAQYVSGLTDAVVTEVLVAGEDEEDTEAFRRRVLSSMTQIAFGGNRQDYINWAKSIPGVAHARIAPTWQTGDDIALEILGENYARPSDETLAAVQAAICPTNSSGQGLGLAPIGHSVIVSRGHGDPVSMEMMLSFQPDADEAATWEAIRVALSALIRSTNEQWDENYTSVLTRFAVTETVERVPGVLRLLSFLMNGVATDISSDGYLVPGGFVYGT